MTRRFAGEGENIPEVSKKNFDTLCAAFDNGHVALLRTKNKETGENVTLICAVGMRDGEYLFTPFAQMLGEEGNPFEQFEGIEEEEGMAIDMQEVEEDGQTTRH